MNKRHLADSLSLSRIIFGILFAYGVFYLNSNLFVILVIYFLAVLSDVSDKLGIKYSVSELKNAITVKNPENTLFKEISDITASANDSKVIVDTVCTVAQEKITELLGVDRVTIIRKGTVAASPSVPNKTKNIMVAFLLSCFTYAAIVFVAFYFNDKIEDAADVEKCLGLTVLGNIPCNSTRRRSK